MGCFTLVFALVMAYLALMMAAPFFEAAQIILDSINSFIKSFFEDPEPPAP